MKRRREGRERGRKSRKEGTENERECRTSAKGVEGRERERLGRRQTGEAVRVGGREY